MSLAVVALWRLPSSTNDVFGGVFGTNPPAAVANDAGTN